MAALRRLSGSSTGYVPLRFPTLYTPKQATAAADMKEEAMSEDELDRYLALVVKRLRKDVSIDLDILDDLIPNDEEIDDNGVTEEEDFLVHKEFVLFPYGGAGRLLTGTLLHYAIKRSLTTYQETEETLAHNLVSYMLEASAAIDAKASYPNGIESNGDEKPRTFLEAIHLAAGLGNVNALEVLDDHATKYKINTTELVNRKTTRGAVKYNAPIHEAAFAGKVNAVTWLLEKKARPDEQTMDGYTALHWLAKHGFEKENELEGVVHALVHAKATLEARTSFTSNAQADRGRTPMEMAVDPGSRYPRRLLVHLSPALNSSSSGNSFLEDLCMLALVNQSAAEEMVKSVKENKVFHSKIKASAQYEGGALLLSYVISNAPVAAADFLQLLWVKPKEEDDRHHPIPTQASLWGLWHDVDMRVAYQPDHKVIQEESGHQILWPLYKYSAAGGSGHGQPEWHSVFHKGSDRDAALNDHVYDVETNALLFPNVLDVQILMALSFVRGEDKHLFHRLPIQACITAGWRLLTKRQYLITTCCFGVVELLTLMNWGFIGAQTGCSSSELICVQSGASFGFAPISWTIVFAGSLRDAVNVIWWFLAYSKHRKEALVGMTKKTRYSCNEINLKAQWSYRRFFMKTSALGKLAFVLAKFVFLFQKLLFRGARIKYEQVWLGVATILQCWRFVYQLRVVISGFNMIIILIYSFFSGIMIEMLAVAIAVYGAFAAAFVMIKKETSLTMAGMDLYRSLIMADGEVFDSVGLDQEEKQPYLTVMMVPATLVFNIVMLNLVIAIYTSEYSQLEKDALSLFFRERAWLTCQESLEHNKLPTWMVVCPRARKRVLSIALLCLAITLGALLPSLWGWQRGALVCIGAGFSCAFGQILLQALLSQRRVRKHMKLKSGETPPRFLWTCHNAELCEHRLMLQTLTPAHMKERFTTIDTSLKQIKEQVQGLGTKINTLIELKQKSKVIRSRARRVSNCASSSFCSSPDEDEASTKTYEPKHDNQLAIIVEEQSHLRTGSNL